MKIFDFRMISQSRFVNVVAVDYEDQRGSRKQWHMVTREKEPKCISGRIDRPDAAIIVPYRREDGKLAVIKEFRVPVGGYQYAFPAGLLDPGEDLAASAGRELREETGLQLVRVYRHSPAIFSSAGITDEAVAIVFAEVTGTPDTTRNEASEDITVFMLDRPAVAELLARSGIVFGARAWLIMDAFVHMGPAYLTGNPDE